MFSSLSHTYFGAFDYILYAAAFLISMSLSRALCEEPQPALAIAQAGPSVMYPATSPTTRPAKSTSTRSTVASKTASMATVVAASVKTVPVVVAADTSATTTKAEPAPALAKDTEQSSMTGRSQPSPAPATIVPTESKILAVAPDEDGDRKANTSVLNLKDIRLYKLHQKSVVRVNDLPLPVPKNIRQYRLHKKSVVRLEDLESVMEVVT